MNRLLLFVTILVINNLLLTTAGRVIVVIPPGQIRRSPALSARPVRAPTYLKLTPINSYGPVRSIVPNLPPNNQVPNGVNNYEPGPDAIGRPSFTSYGKGAIYPPYGRGYVPYDKYNAGPVPSINQNSRYPPDINNRPRQQTSPVYGPTPAPGRYYPEQVANNPYYTDQNFPAKQQQQQQPQQQQQQPIDKPQLPFTGQIQPIGHVNLPSSQGSLQPAASSTYPKVGPIIVRPVSNEQLAHRPGDLLKESSSVVAKVPPPSTANAGKGGIVFQDTLLLDDYEKKIAEFTKSWPKLSAFPGTLGSASSYFPGSSLGQVSSSGVARSSFNFDQFNSIGRQGYAVKEDIDEPPIDFRTMPIITSALHLHPPTPTTIARYKSVFG